MPLFSFRIYLVILFSYCLIFFIYFNTFVCIFPLLYLYLVFAKVY